MPGASQSWHVAIGEKVRKKLLLRGFSSPPSVASRPVCVCPPQPPSFPTFVCTVSGRGGANERPCSSVTLSSAGYYCLGGSLFGRRRGGKEGGRENPDSPLFFRHPHLPPLSRRPTRPGARKEREVTTPPHLRTHKQRPDNSI